MSSTNFSLNLHDIKNVDICIAVHRGTSCKELKQRHPHLKTGTYTLTVGGKTFDAVCDMDTDNGKLLKH